MEQVRETPLQRERLRGNRAVRVALDRDVRVHFLEVGLQRCQQRVEIHGVERLFVVQVAEQAERALDHLRHLIEVRGETDAQVVVLDGLGAQAQARERGAQIVRHRREHARAAFEIAAQPLLHDVERARRLAQFARAFLGERRVVCAAAHGVRGGGELAQRARDRQSHQEQRDRQRYGQHG